MKLEIVLTEKELKQLVIANLQNMLGDVDLNTENLKIKVKSTQNWKAECETAAFRAVYSKVTL